MISRHAEMDALILPDLPDEEFDWDKALTWLKPQKHVECIDEFMVGSFGLEKSTVLNLLEGNIIIISCPVERLGLFQRMGVAEPPVWEAEAMHLYKAEEFSHLQPTDLEAAEEEFRQKLLLSFEREPIEDGYSHPAEQIIEDTLKRYKPGAINWIEAVYHGHTERPAVAANILRCIGRLDYNLIKPWGMEMATKGLSNLDIEIRDAAICAFEIWGGAESVATLKDHLKAETIPWLKDYLRRVIRDLSPEPR